MNIYILSILIISILILILSNQIDMFDNKWNNMIDGIVYINLEKREDRKNLILEELNKLEVDINKVNKVAGIYIPKNGHKGCVQSHILALNIAKMNKWENVLIFEDDMELDTTPEEFNNNVNDILEYMNSHIKWDVIMLGVCSTDDPSWKIQIETTKFVKINKATCAHGYIINKDYIDTLLDLYKYSNDMMKKDEWSEGVHEKYALDQQWFTLQVKDNWYGFRKDLIKQRNIYSTTLNKN